MIGMIRRPTSAAQPRSILSSPRCSQTPSHWRRWLPALAVTAVLVVAADVPLVPGSDGPENISGPFASLLAASTDLGPARGEHVQLTAMLNDDTKPDELIGWAGDQSISVRWRPGDDWAIVEGEPQEMASALGVEIHDYVGRRGQEFYASPQQPVVPAELRDEVTGLGRILSYTPHHTSMPSIFPTEVPDRGLSPEALLTTYNANQLAREGFTGKGQAIVIFAFDGFDQTDLDAYSDMAGLPRFTPTLVGGQAGRPRGELTMDLEVAHAIAPDAEKIVVNARPTVEGDGGYVKIGELLEDTNRQFPGAVWSFSIGWGCDKLITEADLAPVRAALTDAYDSGTSAFNASGDLAGFECKGGDDWDSVPGQADVGLDSVASIPEMTNVGGTTLSTDANGKWLSEQAWFDVPLSQGTGGGVSALYDMPFWQQLVSNDVAPERHGGRRMTPDIAAVADPFTGVRIVLNGEPAVGGGTSQSAPIWAALTAVMNQYLIEHEGRPIGNLNPLLYRVAAGADLPGFRDITLGGNAVDSAGPGYDLVTGLGTPDVANLARNILDLQRTGL